MITPAQKELAARTLATMAAGLFIAAIAGAVTGTIDSSLKLAGSFYTSANFYACAHLIAGRI